MTAGCWRARAEAAGAQGISDVAAACLGFAHQYEPSAATRDAWVKALESSGQLREAARARGAPSVAPAAALGGPHSPAARRSLAEEAKSSLAPAIEALEGATHPRDVARLGDLLWKAGHEDRARAAWTRARIGLDEAGASLSLVPVEERYLSGLFWAGDDVVLVRNVEQIGLVPSVKVTALERVSSSDGKLVQRVLIPRDVYDVSVSADGKRLLWYRDGEVFVADAATGEEVARFSFGGSRLGLLQAFGNADDLLIVIGIESQVEIRNLEGTVLTKIALKGTTPTITRRYTGRGAHHDNILQDSPTWATAFAATRDLSLVAVGGSDSKVRLFDRKTGKTRLLEFSWSYEERRPMGGNPDLNEAVAMRFSDDGRELTVVHTHGDLLRWATATGRATRLSGACTTAEAAIVANRYAGPDDPVQKPDADAERSCAYAKHARFSPDGRLLATTGNQLRVRSLPDGQPVALRVDRDLPDEELAFNAKGDLALADIYGQLGRWSKPNALSTILPSPVETGPIAPTISPSGRFLVFDHGARELVWDLAAKQPVRRDLGHLEKVIATSEDGTRFVVKTARGNELRTLVDAPGIVVTEGDDRPRTWFTRGGKSLVLVDPQLEKPAAAVVRDLTTSVERRFALEGPVWTTALSDDGRFLATTGQRAPVRIWDVATGKLAKQLGPARAIALAPDGSYLASMVRDDEDRSGKAEARLDPIDGGEPHTMIVDGWPSTIAISADGRQIVFHMENAVYLYDVAAKKLALVDKNGWAIGVKAIRYANGAKLFFVDMFDMVQVRRRDDEMSLVATMYPLHSGGWLALSADGAVEGSPDAVEHVLTRAAAGSDAIYLSGRAGWDRFATPDVWALALRSTSAVPAAPGRARRRE